jgi:branched-chain amino acid transport system permease protein
MGLPGIPQPSIFGLQVSSNFGFLILVAVFCAATVWISHRIVRSPFGRVLKAIREDEVFTQAAGKNIAAYKVLVFVIGAGMAAVAGVMYAHYISFIDPTSFTVMESIFIISIVIIGGSGSMWGPVVGAVVLVVLPELLRFIGLPSSMAANIRQILYGGLLVAFMMWRPKGLLGEYAFQGKEARE